MSTAMEIAARELEKLIALANSQKSEIDKLRNDIEALRIDVESDPYNAVGDGVADDTTAIKSAIQDALSNNGTVVLRGGKVYRVTSHLNFTAGGKTVRLISSGGGKAKIVFDISVAGVGLSFTGVQRGSTKTLAENVRIREKWIKPSSLANIEPGYLCEMISTKSWYHDPRSPAEVTHNIGTAQAGTSTTITLASDADNTDTYTGQCITIYDGTGKGHARIITAYDPTTKVATVHRAWKTNPDYTSKYIIPQAYKGELNVVERILGGKIELQNLLNDGYDVIDDTYGDAKEDVRISFYDPVQVEIDGVDFEWIKSPNVGNFECIKIKYGRNCVFRNVEIIQTRRIGFQIERSYNTLIDFCRVRGADGNFLGYGVNVQNSTLTTIRNSYFWGCRRGVDFDSVRDFIDPYPSRFGRVESCVTFGGGIREEGRPLEAPWYPEGDWLTDDALNYGFGSHGPAEHIEYINNRTVNVYRGIFLRGTNERVIGNKFIGKMEECIGVWFGGNFTIADNEYYHPALVGERPESDIFREINTFDGGSILEDFPNRFLNIAILNHSPIPYQKGFVSVRNNDVRAVKREFIRQEWAAGTYWEDTEVIGNHVMIWPESPIQQVFFVNSNNSAQLINWIDKDNHIKVVDGVFRAYRPNLTLGSDCIIIPEHSGIPWSATYNETTVLTAQIPVTASAPTTSQGTEILSIDVDHYSLASKIHITVSGSVQRTDGPGVAVISLFRDTLHIGSRRVYCPAADVPVPFTFDLVYVPSTSQKRTYSVRVGPADTSAGIRMNGSSTGTALFGGVGEPTTLIIREY